MIEAEILRLTAACGPGRSVSPSDVAQAVLPGAEAAWQRELGAVRRVAVLLGQQGRIEILRKGKPVAPEGVKGVIRLRLRVDGPLLPDDPVASDGLSHESRS